MGKLFIAVLLLVAVGVLVACASRSAPRTTTTSIGGRDTADANQYGGRPDILRDGERTDILSAYWEAYFSERGEFETFRLFASRYDEISAENSMEADRALEGFQRFCRLNQCTEALKKYWASRTVGSTEAVETSVSDVPDTATGTRIDSHTFGDLSATGHRETLYRAPSGRFFIHLESAVDSPYAGATADEWISDEAAKKWLEAYSPGNVGAYFPGHS